MTVTKDMRYHTAFHDLLRLGLKGQTRRRMKVQPVYVAGFGHTQGWTWRHPGKGIELTGWQHPSDFAEELAKHAPRKVGEVFQVADEHGEPAGFSMVVTRVRAEKVRDITEADAMQEGADCLTSIAGLDVTYRGAWPAGGLRAQFWRVWDVIYPGSRDCDEWAWVYDLRLAEG